MLTVDDISFKLYIFIRCKIITSAWKYMFMYTYVYVYSVIAEKKNEIGYFSNLIHYWKIMKSDRDLFDKYKYFLTWNHPGPVNVRVELIRVNKN